MHSTRKHREDIHRRIRYLLVRMQAFGVVVYYHQGKCTVSAVTPSGMCEQILKNTQDGLEMESTETLETQTISNTTNSSETVLGIAYLCCTPFIC